MIKVTFVCDKSGKEQEMVSKENKFPTIEQLCREYNWRTLVITDNSYTFKTNRTYLFCEEVANEMGLGTGNVFKPDPEVQSPADVLYDVFVDIARGVRDE